jgi:hypothetical protein
MKRMLRIALFVGTAACIFSFFGCRNKHIQDGPGMINDLNWKAFTLSRSDSYAQYNFSFTVEKSGSDYLLTGDCRDEEGNEYCVEEGFRLSARDIPYLRSLNLGNLPDVTPASPDEGEELILLDAPTITLFVTDPNDTVREKATANDFSIDFYERFLPYFINQ